MNNYINLQRTFTNFLPSSGNSNDYKDGFSSLKKGLADFGWNDILRKNRVIVLAEAGAGKTFEFRAQAMNLAKAGSHAFFLRLEDLARGLEFSFEEDSHFLDFEVWLNSDKKAYIFLDSVDEARITDPRDFEIALRILRKGIVKGLDRVSIFISSRVAAWRPNEDLEMCNKHFSVQEKQEKVSMTVDHDNATITNTLRSATREHAEIEDGSKYKFVVYALNDLIQDQARIFSAASNVTRPADFFQEIQRVDGWDLTSRPQDLDELIGYWNQNLRIGSKLELLEFSISRRLQERSGNRSSRNFITRDKILLGATRLAAASILLQKNTISLPNSSYSGDAIDVRKILSDWNDNECDILLGRPIFDPAFYGTVRFYHRSAKEYLTAKWILSLVSDSSSDRKVTELFVSQQYGEVVIIPALRPVLSWLLLFNPNLTNTILTHCPDVLFTNGDPTRLPVVTRRKMLHFLCEEIVKSNTGRYFEISDFLPRFAGQDLEPEIKLYIKKTDNSDNLKKFLIRFIQHANLKVFLPYLKKIAVDKLESSTNRSIAILVIGDLDDTTEIEKIYLDHIVLESQIDRFVLTTCINSIKPSVKTIDHLFIAIEKLDATDERGNDSLGMAISAFADRGQNEDLIKLVQNFSQLIRKPPLRQERDFELSSKYAWVIHPAIHCIVKLVEAKDPYVLTDDPLYILTQMRAYQEPNTFFYKDYFSHLRHLVRAWTELNHCLFWKKVEVTNINRVSRGESLISDFRQISFFSHNLYSFSNTDLPHFVDAIYNKKNVDQKLTALSIAFYIINNIDDSEEWLRLAKKAVEINPEITHQFNFFLSQQIQIKEENPIKLEESNWVKEHKAAEGLRLEREKAFKNRIINNPSILVDSGLPDGQLSNDQFFFYNHAKKGKPDSRLSLGIGNWKTVADEFGIDVATAFQSGAKKFWRKYTPALKSENSNTTQILSEEIFGLCGFEMELEDNPSLIESLNDYETAQATRYALRELNEFPNWFQELYAFHSKVIDPILMNEVTWELNNSGHYHYILSRITWAGEWLTERLAPNFEKFIYSNPSSIEHLESLLRIMLGSKNVLDNTLASCARSQCKQETELSYLAIWFSVWILTDPEAALHEFDSRLRDFAEDDFIQASKLMMLTVVWLLNKRLFVPAHRTKYLKPHVLMKLYLLSHEYIKASDDIERVGKGVYSPGLRDDAQDARDKIFSILKDIPGKATYLAIKTIAYQHPDSHHRSWMLQTAKLRANTDGDLKPWSAEQFADYSRFLESSPKNHFELFNLAQSRLLDLKFDIEQGDSSLASILIPATEVEVRNFIANQCRLLQRGRYIIPQEEEMADAKRTDLRFHHVDFDGPVPIELKLADKWNGPKLFERLKNQLCGDYLRDVRSNNGIYLLVYRGERKSWGSPFKNGRMNFQNLIKALAQYWKDISNDFPNINNIEVIGIDLTTRTSR